MKPTRYITFDIPHKSIIIHRGALTRIYHFSMRRYLLIKRILTGSPR